MQATFYTLVEARIGWLGLAWNETGITQLQLPGSDRASTERMLLRRESAMMEQIPNVWVAEVCEKLKRYGAGEPIDFTDVPVSLEGIDPFRRAIYAAARGLGFGQNTTYGALAIQAGHPGLARETGKALGQNPVPIIVPCHRIVAAGNKIGGFSAPGGSVTKEKLLAMEGVQIAPPPPAQESFGF
ncbi:methylated-DNA--[protein]-cysteine S-methyltransferase [Mesorhizobium sp. NBSH29]|uniref:methylated-DNA--[protein]-cysteine S-methyltransferase n=1 Tax=Mesorhizobium sp. NBSH29 TaxID=2654249 RepID=UPI001896931D|nr:methylated-DNA--[protein]-cysteine S-methyltransferase [Mesorhizobium sp. NBSH29]QPC88377.1 methylated-DNA--[protein]-cysteine S-methyltransferase [Mesorhizobium sp. NBSH29]